MTLWNVCLGLLWSKALDGASPSELAEFEVTGMHFAKWIFIRNWSKGQWKAANMGFTRKSGSTSLQKISKFCPRTCSFRLVNCIGCSDRKLRLNLSTGIRFSACFIVAILASGCERRSEISDLVRESERSPAYTSSISGGSQVLKGSLDLLVERVSDSVVRGTKSVIGTQNELVGPSREEESINSFIYSAPSEVVGLIRSFVPNGEILNIDVSSDGEAVVFESSASNLVRGDTNRTTDVFLLDASHRLLKRVSVDSSGSQVFGNSANPRISPDGGWVVFESSATGLDARDENRFKDVFLHEIGTGETTLVSLSVEGFSGNRDSGNPVVSHNAEMISFESEATNLVEVDENKSSDVFVYSRLLQSMRVVSTPVLTSLNDANHGNLSSYNPELSDDGEFVTFESFSPSLTLDDYNSNSDVFLHNLISQKTELVSTFGPRGSVISGDSSNPSVSGDGNTVVFQSRAQFFENDLNGVQDVFIYDVSKSRLTRLPAEELQPDVSGSYVRSSQPVISGDGSVVVYEISLSGNDDADQNSTYRKHLVYYKTDGLDSGRLDLFQFDIGASKILDYSVSLSEDAGVLAFHVSRTDDSLSGHHLAAKSSWMTRKHDVN